MPKDNWKSRAGRPPKADDEVLGKKISVNLNKKLWAFAESQAETLCITPTEYIRGLLEVAYNKHTIQAKREKALRKKGASGKVVSTPDGVLSQKVEQLLEKLSAIDDDKKQLLAALQDWQEAKLLEEEDRALAEWQAANKLDEDDTNA